jgi:hypothetical protein
LIDLEYIPPSLQQYVKWVKEFNVITLLEKDYKSGLSFFEKISKEKQDYYYAPGKWSVKEIIQHLSDVERIFTYRALRFSRLDPIELPGFDENYYLEATSLDEIPYRNLLSEWASLRESTILFYKNIDPKFLDRTGRAGGQEFSVKSIGYILAGHTRHHIEIIKERYLAE